MKTSEIRDLSIDDLRAKSLEISEELCKLKIQHSIRPLENPARLKQLRKNVARLQTIITEKQQAS
ncbi:MAG: 50S ribosomal protein L29 [Thermodesulfobacteriota bacterium]